jgi:hypothetical protein
LLIELVKSSARLVALRKVIDFGWPPAVGMVRPDSACNAPLKTGAKLHALRCCFARMKMPKRSA